MAKSLLILILTLAFAACGESKGLDEDGFLAQLTDGELINGTCVAPGEAFEDTYECAGVEGPSPHQEQVAVSHVSAPDPGRLEDPDNEWVVEQLQACSCTCCHSAARKGVYRWANDFEPHWLDSASGGVLESLAGYNATGHRDEELNPEKNHGFSRRFGVPSTDPERFRDFIVREIDRR